MLLKACKQADESSNMEVILGSVASLNDEISWFKKEASKWDVHLTTVPHKAKIRKKRNMSGFYKAWLLQRSATPLPSQLSGPLREYTKKVVPRLLQNLWRLAREKVAGNDKDSILICFASKTTNAGQITSNLHVIELGAQPGIPGFSKKQADLFFLPDFADDFLVSMQVNFMFVIDALRNSKVCNNRTNTSMDPNFYANRASK